MLVSPSLESANNLSKKNFKNKCKNKNYNIFLALKNIIKFLILFLFALIKNTLLISFLTKCGTHKAFKKFIKIT